MYRPDFPQDFSTEARQVYENPPKGFQAYYKHPDLPLAVGTRVYTLDRLSAVVVGFNDTLALVVLKDGITRGVVPTSLTLKCSRYQCDAEATSGPNVHHHHWRYCESCRRKLAVDVPEGPGFGIMFEGLWLTELVGYSRDPDRARVWRTPHRARRFLAGLDPVYAHKCSVVMLTALEG